MAIKRKPTKNVIVTNTTVLYELGGIRGPILSPSPIAVDDILKLVSNGINVYEVDPNNSNNKIKLDRNNYNKTNFKPKKKVEVSLTPVITTSPVEENNTDNKNTSTEYDYKTKKDKKK